tara:strand:- start:953 stop:1645 length:693 start_codon:yes stop_codon:yes gene_type:complete
MSTYSSIRDILKQYLFIIYNETYTDKKNNNFIERYVAKHPLLKPELIIVNDQLHGFKKVSKKAASLEEFPIYLEIEGVFDEANIHLIDSIDIYCETQINCQDRLTDIIYFTKLFGQYVTLERGIDVLSPLDEVIVIKSKIQEYLVEFSIESIGQDISKILEYDSIEEHNSQDAIEIEEFYIDINQFKKLLTIHLKYFVKFIQVCHDLLIKNKTLEVVSKDVNSFLAKESK